MWRVGRTEGWEKMKGCSSILPPALYRSYRLGWKNKLQRALPSSVKPISLKPLQQRYIDIRIAEIDLNTTS